MQDLLGKTSTFRAVVGKDTDFFGQAGIIDYSLLLGRIETFDENGEYNIDPLLQMISEDPSLSHGVYITAPTANRPAQAYVIAIIDPLTGFTFKKTLEFRFKQMKH